METGEDDTYHVCASDDLGDGDRITVLVQGREVTIFRLDGDLYGLLDYCPHQGGPLCQGRVMDEISVDEDFEWRVDPTEKVIRCPWHGWGFDPKTGEHKLGNGIETKYRVPSYDVVTDEGEIYLRIQ